MRLFASSLLSTILSLAILASVSISASAATTPEEELPLKIDADHVVWDREKRVITAQGFAHARYGDIFLAADHMEYHQAKGDLKARGNVVFEYKGDRIFAQRMDFNVNTTLGIFYDAEGYIGGAYFITSKKVERISPTRYVLEDGSFTTCRCNNPAWLFTARRGTLYVDRFAVFRRAGFLIKGLPVASLPLFVLPAKTERSTGFLFPLLGESSVDGFIMKNRFFWAINERSDATIGLDYLSKRGLRPNLEYRYIAARDSYGNIYGSALKDRLTDVTFYQVRGKHYQRFKHDVVSELKVDLESAVSPSRAFELDVERRAKVRTDSFLYARKNWKDRALQMENRFFKSTLERRGPSFAILPELTFFNARERLSDTPLYYDVTFSGSNFIEEIPGGGKSTVSRMDFFPRLSLPLGSRSWWGFTQSIGFRETAYSEQRGRRKPLTRELFYSQSLLEAPRLYRTFDLSRGKIDRIVHIVEPVVAYTYISDNEVDAQKRIFDFDEVDDFGATNALSYALTNRFIAREVGEGGKKRVREVARITLGQRYDIRQERDGNRGGEPLSEILIDVETWLVPALRVDFEGLYSLEEDSLETMNFEVDYRFLRYFDLEFDSRLKRGRRPAGMPRTDYIRAGIGASPARGWYLEYAARVNMLLEKKVVESSFIASYTSQCWGITARLVDRVQETTVDFQIELFGVGGLGEKIGRLVSPEVLPRL